MILLFVCVNILIKKEIFCVFAQGEGCTVWFKIQKVLRFIPAVNLATVVSWLVVGAKKKLGLHYFVKNVVIMFALAAIVIMIGRGLATFTSNEVFSNVLFYGSLVIYTYIGAFISVNEQEYIANGKYDK